MGATPFRRQRGARFRPGRIPRRALLRAAAGAGLGAAAWTIAGCGDDEAEPQREPDHPPPPEATAGALATPIAPPVPDTPPRPGGALRMHGTLEALDFFDIHRSQLVNTQAFSALQQNRLIRYADFDAGVLEGDLAGLPEIPAEDTYVFMLRADVRWWDRPPTNGRRFTAEDVRVNVERQVAALDAAGAADPLFRRHSTYAAGGVPEALDERTVLFRTHGPDATYLTHAHAGPWSFYQAPEIWTAYGDRLRDDPINPDYYSGTGPFIIDTLRPREGVTFRRNPDFFRSGLPHLDRFEYLHLPNAEAQERAYREGRVDVWSPGDPLALEPARVEFPDHILTQRPLPFGIVLTFLYHQRAAGNPFRDPRVARATHLALDRHDLMDATYRGFARLSGAAPWFTPGWALPESELLLQPGYRRDKTADRATARALLAAAGFSGPLPLVLPDGFVATYPGVDLRIRRDLERGLGIALAITLAHPGEIAGRVREGSLPASIGWGPAIIDPDPTDALLRSMHSAGAENFGGYANPEVDAALDRMRITLDAAERQRIFRSDVHPALLADPAWTVSVAHGLQRTLRRPSVRAPRFGSGWDWHRFQEAWIA